MWMLDFSLNQLTLLALTLVIGILVDDSIVVIENIYRHLENDSNSVDTLFLQFAALDDDFDSAVIE